MRDVFKEDVSKGAYAAKDSSSNRTRRGRQTPASLWLCDLCHFGTMMIWFNIYLLQLAFHQVAGASKLVQKLEKQTYIQKEKQYTNQYSEYGWVYKQNNLLHWEGSVVESVGIAVRILENIFFLYLNLVKPTGHVMYHQFNIQQLYVLPILYLWVLYLSESKQRLVPLTA